VAGRTGRPKKDPSRRLEVQIGLRVKNDLAELIDKKAAELERLHPGSTWERPDVVRHLLYKLFEAETHNGQDGVARPGG
jgi:hypothetical protein